MGRQWASPAFNFPGQLLPFQLTPSVTLGGALPWGPSHDECCKLQPGQGGPRQQQQPLGEGRTRLELWKGVPVLGDMARTLSSTLGPPRARGLLNGCSALTWARR